MIQITFRPDGTAEHIGDQTYPAASLVAGPGRKRRASHVEPANFWLRQVFHALRLLDAFALAVGEAGAESQPLTAWTRQWGCYWRVRVVGGPTLPGVYKDRDSAIREEVRWLEEHRL